jgi:sugar/nucleoside kinase (ribokinase family)
MSPCVCLAKPCLTYDELARPRWTCCQRDLKTIADSLADEIEFPPPLPAARDIPGGAGTYSALGARLFSSPPLSKTVGWIVDQGTDWPAALSTLLSSWETSCLLRPSTTRLTTRGWNGYTNPSDPSHRSFRYTTPKQRLTADDLTATPLLQARAIHLICSPLRCRELVTSILAQRKAEARARDPFLSTYVRPLFIWEPVPDLCTPDELLNLTNALPLVDVCSPNHAELAGFMGSDGLDPATGGVSAAAVERSCEQLLASMPLQSYALVVRAGDQGCYVARNGGRKKKARTAAAEGARPPKKKEHAHGGLQLDMDMMALLAGLVCDGDGSVAREEIEIDPGVERWFPAYYRGGEEGKVVDPTGGGNTFLGAMAVALARGKNIEEACVWGNVAASFAIEQVGVPVLGKDEEGWETWNAVRVDERLKDYQERF